MPAQPSPITARVRMYQVGFGDCLLLTFEYAQPLTDGRSERHILFDCGSTRGPWDGWKMKNVTDKIQEHTGGQLDVLVSTHRHKDHVSGFGSTATDDAFAAMTPHLVVQAWTEDPKIAKDAIEPAFGARNAVAGMRADRETMSQLADRIVAWIDALPADEQSRRRYRLLSDLAADQIPNKKAVENLETWSQGGKGHYVYFGNGHERLEAAVPGVGFKVVGPPTLKQHPKLRSYADTSDEYWIAASKEVGATLESLVGDEQSHRTGARIPLTAQPIVDRLRDTNAESLLNIVRRMDNFLNNTSVILLINAGNKRMLFGGDAQVENWDYTRENHPALWQELASIDLYKVGHHGSRNASPKKLVEMWPETPPGATPRMVALMSTQEGAHGEEDNDSEVPRKPLVEALKKRATLFSTAELPEGQLWLEVSADLAANAPFALVQQP